jgi:molecular chaperone HtpG
MKFMEANMSKNAETFEFQTEMKKLLNLIVHSLYTHPEVFLRELISNASDASHKVRFYKLTNNDILDADADLEIKITIDEKEKTFSIEDNGIGMNKEDLIANLGTIARSGTKEFLESINNSENLNENLIGQFGVGFYASFMVTDEIIVETREMKKDSQGYQWKSDGTGSFEIEPCDKKHAGQKFLLNLKKAKVNLQAIGE